MLLKNRKAIMLRSRLKNKANYSKNPEDMTRYKKQRNLVVNMNRHAKKTFFTENLDSKKCFWKIIKPFFNAKGVNIDGERIVLVQNG